MYANMMFYLNTSRRESDFINKKNKENEYNYL